MREPLLKNGCWRQSSRWTRTTLASMEG